MIDYKNFIQVQNSRESEMYKMNNSLTSPNLLQGPRVANSSERRIVTYFPEWGIYQRNYQISDVPWDKITHFNYAFVDIDLQNGTVKLFDDHAANINLPAMVEYSARFPNVTTMFSIGGWSRSAGFRNAAATQANRQRFADSCVDFLRRWGFGGVDVDWEYPTFRREGDSVDNPNDQGTPQADITEAETFPLLLKTLRETLDRAGQQDGRYYPLTAAVSINPNITNLVRPDTYEQYLDFINLMSYDMHGAWESVTGHHSPLYANPFAPHDEFERLHFNTDAAMRSFESFGVHPNKLVLGVPFYTRGWGDVSRDFPIRNVMHNGESVTLPGLFAATRPESVKGEWDGGRNAGTSSFDFAEDVLIRQRGFTKYRDPWARVPYIYNESLGQMFTYDDEISVREKSEYVNTNNFGGIIVWDLSGNRDGRLLQIMNEVMFGSSNATGEGTLTLRMSGSQFGFTPRVTVHGQTYDIPFGSDRTISLPAGNNEVDVWWARTRDFTTFWEPIYAPRFVNVPRSGHATLNIHYEQRPGEAIASNIQGAARLRTTTTWDGGGRYALDIINEGSSAIPHGWNATFSTRGSNLILTGIDNGTLNRNGNNFTIGGPSWNTAGIAPGTTLTLTGDFSGSLNANTVPDRYFINGQRIGVIDERMIIVDNNFAPPVTPPPVTPPPVTPPPVTPPVTPTCYEVTVGSGEDVVHALRIQLTNNSNTVINNWEFGFDFGNVIEHAVPHVRLNRNGNRYTITSDGSMPNLMPHTTIEFTLYFHKLVNDTMSNLMINNQVICDNYIPAPGPGGPTTPPPIQPPVVTPPPIQPPVVTPPPIQPPVVTPPPIQPPVVTPPPIQPPLGNEWNPLGFYNAGDIVTHQGRQYMALITFQGHGDPSWSPVNASTIWRPL